MANTKNATDVIASYFVFIFEYALIPKIVRNTAKIIPPVCSNRWKIWVPWPKCGISTGIDNAATTPITTKVSSVGLLSTNEEYFDNIKWHQK